MIQTIQLPYYKKRPMSFVEANLYWDYKNELWQISKDHGYADYVVRDWYLEILNGETNVLRIIDDSRLFAKQIGFVFIGVYGNCHPDADYYIQDCYIVPEYRKRHIMEQAVKQFIKKHSGTYCMFILDDNLPAIDFWNKVFSDLGYNEIFIEDVNDMETYNCHIHAYSKEG